jgi:hypothetical protein
MKTTAAITLLLFGLGLAGRARADEPAEPAPDCPERSCPDPRWEAPRIAGAYDFLPGTARPFQVVVDPISWNLGAWNLGPVVALSAPVSLGEGLELDAWHLQLGAWWVVSGATMRWRVGPELGLCLRRYSLDDDELLRDWLPAVGGRAAVSWLVLERWRIEPGIRLVGEWPASKLEPLGDPLSLPTWHAQFVLGVHLPTPGR